MPPAIASSFADPEDIAAYKKAVAEGKSEAEALKVGDNGIGKWEISRACFAPDFTEMILKHLLTTGESYPWQIVTLRRP